ncbi:MAG: 2OG-Fe(II) oxygenase [Actinomycetota bacterium]
MGLLRKSSETGVLSESPRIEVHDNFATREECVHIIELARDEMNSATIINGEGEKVENNLRRTANIGWVYTDQTPIVRDLVMRVSELVDHPARHCERIQVVHYEVGGKYTPHLDTFKPEEDNAFYRRSGQRLLTGLLYLHEPAKGGATNFPKAKAKVKPKIGRLAVFDLVHPGSTEPDLASVHAGTPVWSGEKWVCNFWFCERPVKTASKKGSAKAARAAKRGASKPRRR